MKPTKKEKEWIEFFELLKEGESPYFCMNCGEKRKFNATWVTRNKYSAPMKADGEINYKKQSVIYSDENDDDDQTHCGSCDEGVDELNITSENIKEIISHIDNYGDFMKKPTIIKNQYLIKWLAANSI